MDITKQVLTEDQIKQGFTLEEQTDDFVTISLKGKELCQFTQGSSTTKEVIQNTVETLWSAYSCGFIQGRKFDDKVD